jgi:uroporphyrinogen decarboxylase
VETIMTFEPDYRHILTAACNQRPARLPLYEHYINDESVEGLSGRRLVGLVKGNKADLHEYFTQVCGFWREMTYDTVSYEVCTSGVMPGGGALMGERAGVIQTRADFEAYPWDDLPRIYWETAAPRFDMLRECLPPGMKAVGGVGNGIFEISEDIVGYQQLCYMQVDDPELFAELYVRIGEFTLNLWSTLLERYSDVFAVCRIGDDMGFKTATLLAPRTLIEHVVPQYRRIIARIHRAGKKFLLHSCGNLFAIMDDLIDAGINAKHSNEDAIAPFDEWIRRYSGRIALFGGIDTDRLCRMAPDDIYAFTMDQGRRFRATAGGYALGSGNSIPPYVPKEGYLAMIRAAQALRVEEGM